MWDMRTDAQVDHGAAAIDGSRGTVRNLGFNEMLLVFVVLDPTSEPAFYSGPMAEVHLEHLQQRLLGHHNSLKLLLGLDGTFGEPLQNGIVGVCDSTSVDGHFVEETVIRGRTNAQVTSVVFLCGFSEDVGR